MDRQIIRTDGAPAAIGPYSQAVVAAGLIFISGQIPLDPATGKTAGGTIEEQTTTILKNMEAILTAASSGLHRVVKTTIYLRNLEDFGAVNEVYGRYFKTDPPARATVEVSGLPKGVSIEIDAIALAC